MNLHSGPPWWIATCNVILAMDNGHVLEVKRTDDEGIDAWFTRVLIHTLVLSILVPRDCQVHRTVTNSVRDDGSGGVNAIQA